MAEVTGWDRFWSCYPRRLGKGAALKAWGKLDPDEELVTKIVLSVDAQKRHRSKMEDANKSLPEKYKKFIPDWPHPSTWLNQQRWEDELASVTEIKDRGTEEQKSCCKCNKSMSIRIDNHWIIVNNSWYCNRCWTITFEMIGVKETSLSVLRDAYKRRTPQKTDEPLFVYLKRALKLGSENVKNSKAAKKISDDEAMAERVAIQQEGIMAQDSGNGPDFGESIA